MVGIELVLDRVTKKPYAWKERVGIRVSERARDLGVIIRPLGNVIVLMPPLGITLGTLKELSDVVYKSIRDITERQ
jgi:adenosylmethionine-8-amino-7-oxononanoate aminotransferase